MRGPKEYYIYQCDRRDDYKIGISITKEKSVMAKADSRKSFHRTGQALFNGDNKILI